MIKQASVSEAHELQQRGSAYVDVRSTPEFAGGHPKGALNVPIFEPDEDTGQMAPNPDFMRVMQATFAPDAPLLIGCQVGGRAVRAAQMLASFGFTDRHGGPRRFPGQARSARPRGRSRLGRCRPAGSQRRVRWRRLPRPARQGRRHAVIASFFHAWERRLASVDTNRVVRPFAWGLDWLGLDGAGDPAAQLADWSARTMRDTDAFYAATPAGAFERRGNLLTFASAITTPHPENNLVRVRIFPAARTDGPASPRGGRAAAVERRRGRPRRPLPSLRPLWPHRAAPQPAVPRRTTARGSRARRVHRQLERRPARRPSIDRPSSTRGGPSTGSRRRATNGSASSARALDPVCRCWRWRTTRDFAPARSITSRRSSPTSCGGACRRRTSVPASRAT